MAALCVAALAAALAAEPAPAHAGKVVFHIGTKGSPAAQPRTQTMPEAAQQIWRRRATSSAKGGGQGALGRAPDAHAGGVHGVTAATTATGVAARPQGASPLSGAGKSAADRISGTGLPVRGAAPAIIHPAAKTGARISGTGLAGRNR